MTSFKGFPSSRIRLTPVPGPFFTELLPQIDHLGELKVTLYVFWQLDHREGTFRALRRVDFTGDESFMQGLGRSPRAAETILDEALERAVGRGTLLKAVLPDGESTESFYLLNSPKGRAAIAAIERGEWSPLGEVQPPVTLDMERPNIFRLYEENFGPLTPLIADTLRDAENTYPPDWIEDAIRISVELNKRSWRYAEAILKRWQSEGRDEQDGRNAEKDRRRYIQGKYSEFIEH
jgi:DNA replication protein